MTVTQLLAAAAVVSAVGMLLAWWRAENRADRADARRDVEIAAREAAEHQARVATDLANRHWADLRAARAELARLQQPEEEWWASVPRETSDSNAGGHRALSAAERPTELLPVLRGHLDTAVLPTVPGHWKGYA